MARVRSYQATSSESCTDCAPCTGHVFSIQTSLPRATTRAGRAFLQVRQRLVVSWSSTRARVRGLSRRWNRNDDAPLIEYPGAVKEVLAVRGLTKKFDDVTALDDVTFAIDGPRLVGILGPNGA